MQLKLTVDRVMKIAPIVQPMKVMWNSPPQELKEKWPTRPTEAWRVRKRRYPALIESHCPQPTGWPWDRVLPPVQGWLTPCIWYHRVSALFSSKDSDWPLILRPYGEYDYFLKSKIISCELRIQVVAKENKRDKEKFTKGISPRLMCKYVNQ